MSVDNLFPPRKVKQVNPQDAVVTVKVTFHGPIAPDDNGEPFVRYFPDMGTWERVKQHLNWTYASIEVEPVNGVIKPGGKFVAR